jgi:hypothetical protein
LKDSLGKFPVPTIYILPSSLFDLTAAVSLAETQIPAFYCKFAMKQRITVLTDVEGEKVLRQVFQSSFLGPRLGEFVSNC